MNACLYRCLESGSTGDGVYLFARYVSCKQLRAASPHGSVTAFSPDPGRPPLAPPASTAPWGGSSSSPGDCWLSVLCFPSTKHILRLPHCIEQGGGSSANHSLSAVSEGPFVGRHLSGCKLMSKSNLHQMSQGIFSSVLFPCCSNPILKTHQ